MKIEPGQEYVCHRLAKRAVEVEKDGYFLDIADLFIYANVFKKALLRVSTDFSTTLWYIYIYIYFFFNPLSYINIIPYHYYQLYTWEKLGHVCQALHFRDGMC